MKTFKKRLLTAGILLVFSGISYAQAVETKESASEVKEESEVKKGEKDAEELKITTREEAIIAMKEVLQELNTALTPAIDEETAKAAIPALKKIQVKRRKIQNAMKTLGKPNPAEEKRLFDKVGDEMTPLLKQNKKNMSRIEEDTKLKEILWEHLKK